MKYFYLIVTLIISATSCHAENMPSFSKTLSLQGVTFIITGANSGSFNKLVIAVDGLKDLGKPIEREVEGTFTGAEVADLNSDGSPEVYVYVTSVGSGSYGSLVAHAVNKKKSISEIYLPDILSDQKLSKGYMGHDEFAIVENSLVRRFSIYKEGDTNSKPTGGLRQIEYKLKPGEAGWILKVKNTTDFN